MELQLQYQLAQLLIRWSSIVEYSQFSPRTGNLQYCNNVYTTSEQGQQGQVLHYALLRGCFPYLPSLTNLSPQLLIYINKIFCVIYIIKCLIGQLLDYSIALQKKMYFKERERSILYKRQQSLQQIRLSNKLQEIKNRKIKLSHSELLLPQITHRLPQVKPCHKIAVTLQTERLNKRILQLKSNRSQYFTKVIGINLSRQSSKVKKSQLSNSTQLSSKNEEKENIEEPITRRLDH